MAKYVSQRSSRPRAQAAQSPQGMMKLETTRSPGRTPATSSPTASTIPEISCPRTTGIGNFRSPLAMCRSEWQTPQAAILMRTSPSLGSGWRSSSIRSGVPTAERTAAFTATMLLENEDVVERLDARGVLPLPHDLVGGVELENVGAGEPRLMAQPVRDDEIAVPQRLGGREPVDLEVGMDVLPATRRDDFPVLVEIERRAARSRGNDGQSVLQAVDVVRRVGNRRLPDDLPRAVDLERRLAAGEQDVPVLQPLGIPRRALALDDDSRRLLAVPIDVVDGDALVRLTDQKRMSVCQPEGGMHLAVPVHGPGRLAGLQIDLESAAPVADEDRLLPDATEIARP